MDLSRVVLTHHRLADQGQRNLPLGVEDPQKLDPMRAPGAGEVQEKEKEKEKALLGPGQLYEALRERGDARQAGS